MRVVEVFVQKCETILSLCTLRIAKGIATFFAFTKCMHIYCSWWVITQLYSANKTILFPTQRGPETTRLRWRHLFRT